MLLNFKKVTGAEITDEDAKNIQKTSNKGGGGNRLRAEGEFLMELVAKLPRQVKETTKDKNWQSVGLSYKVVEGEHKGKTFTENCMVPVAGTTKHVSDSDKWTALGKYIEQMKGLGYTAPKFDSGNEDKAAALNVYRAELSNFINTTLSEVFGNEKGALGAKVIICTRYQGYHGKYEECTVKDKKAFGFMLYDNKGKVVEAFSKKVEKEVGASGNHPFTKSEQVEAFMLEKRININETTRQPRVNFDLEVGYRKLPEGNTPQENVKEDKPVTTQEQSPAPVAEEPKKEKEPWEID